MKRAVAYVRVSKDDTDMLHSLKSQRQHFMEEIKKRGYELVISCGDGGIYADEGITATQTKHRKAFLQMIADAKQNKFDIIFTKEVSRFARNTLDTLKYTRELKKFGIGVYFETDNIYTLDNDGELRLTLMATLAQEESRKISMRTKFGLRQSAKNGIWKGPAPYGYNKENKKLIINEEEAKIVNDIYNFYLQGWGVTKITNYLNNNNIPTKKGEHKKRNGKIGKVAWSQVTVSAILKNPIYIGLMRQHRTENIDVTEKIKVKVPENEWIEYKDEKIKIIEDELFYNVQEAIKQRSEVFGQIKVTMSQPDEEGKRKRISTEVMGRKGRNSDKHIFSNLLYCQNCGASMKRKKKHAYKRKDGTSNNLGYEWVCVQQDMYGKHKCTTLHRNVVSEEYLITTVKKAIGNLIHDKNIDSKYSIYLKYKLNDKMLEKLPKIDNELDELNQLVTFNMKQAAKGIITEEQFELIAKEAKEKIEQLKKEKDKIQNLDRERMEVEKKKKEIVEFVKNSNLDNIDNNFLKKIISKIYIERDPRKHLSDEQEALIYIDWNLGIPLTDEEYWEFGEKEFKEDITKGIVNFG